MEEKQIQPYDVLILVAVLFAAFAISVYTTGDKTIALRGGASAQVSKALDHNIQATDISNSN